MLGYPKSSHNNTTSPTAVCQGPKKRQRNIVPNASPISYWLLYVISVAVLPILLSTFEKAKQ